MEYPTEQEYAEAFGVELEDGSESAQDGAEEREGLGGDPARETDAEGAAEGAGDENEPSGETEQDGTPEGTQEQSAVMSAEERHRQAAMRRAREEQERQAAEQSRRDQIYADLFRGQTSPYTGKQILTEADYRAHLAAQQQRRQTEQLQQAGIDPQTIQGMVEQQIAPMKAKLEAAELAAVQERARAANARAQEAMKQALVNISAMDPSIKTVEDIVALPTGPKFNALIQKGIGMEDAFYLANRQEIEGRRTAAARTAAINGMANRAHLNPTRSAAAQLPVEVPKEVVDAYRYMMPGATDAEIREAYAAEFKK